MKETDFQSKVILYSEIENGPPIISFQLRYPRMAHAEFLTHRVFSRNARSSRAVPVKTLLSEEIYVPHFMRNKPGMQASEEFTDSQLEFLENEWIAFAKKTQEFSEFLSSSGVHKQWANRPLEWFGYIDTLLTTTDLDNFFNLRLHRDAMPEIRELAKAVTKSLNDASRQQLNAGEWHIPYILPEEKDSLDLDTLLKLSVARCARVSYAPFDGNASIEKEIERYNLLKNSNPIHASPFEHQAKVYDPDYINRYGFDQYKISNLRYPWVQYRKFIEQGLM